jgi:enediyne biosynthesis protein E4
MTRRSPRGPGLCASAVIAAYAALAPTMASENVTFTDVTKESGITFSHVWSPDKKYILESMSGGVAIADFDKDGLPDVYLVNAPTVAAAGGPRSARSELWRNRETARSWTSRTRPAWATRGGVPSPLLR